MKSNAFNYSLLAVGVAALMGVSTGAMAATSGNAGTDSKTIENIASASYSVGGVPQEDVQSNPVTVNIDEVISFSLVAKNDDGTINDDINTGIEVAPNGFVEFKHTLENTGNLDDVYTLDVSDLSNGKYVLADSTADVVITLADGSTTTQTLTNLTTSKSLSLPAGATADITINAKTTGNVGNETPSLELRATSTKIESAPNGATPTLTNADEAITILPVFSIAKTITSGTFDVNTPDAEVTYQVVVKNVNLAYSDDATNVTIEDFLPDGLIMTQDLTSTDITTTGSVTIDNSSIATTADDSGFSLIATSLPKDSSITITFKAKKDPDVDLAQDALNHVSVSDDLDDDANTDNTLVDSTDTIKEQNINFYPEGDTNFTNGNVVNGNDGDDSTQPLNSTQRSLTLTNKEIIQIPTTTNGTTQANHTVTVTNTGRDTESNLTFTIDESDTATNVSVSDVQVDGVAVTADNGVYTIPGTLNANESIDITYVVSSNDAKVGEEEETTVTLITDTTPGNAPTVPPIVDETRVRGIKLLKTQSLDANCDGVSDNGTFTDTSFTAFAGECVVYNIQATNTFDSSVDGSYDIASLLISDDLIATGVAASADYLDQSVNNNDTNGSTTIGNVAAPTTTNDQVVSNDVGTLAPGSSANLQFAVKIKQD